MSDNNQTFDSEASIKALTSKEDLLGIAIDIESYFDSNSLYVFDNWIDGQIVAGPFVRKYWIELTLKYPYNRMPDPDGGLRLTPHGTKISYRKAKEMVPMSINDPSDYEPGTKKPRMKAEPIWLIEMKIPRRFVEAVNNELLDVYADELEEPAEVENGGANSGAEQLPPGEQL